MRVPSFGWLCSDTANGRGRSQGEGERPCQQASRDTGLPGQRLPHGHDSMAIVFTLQGGQLRVCRNKAGRKPHAHTGHTCKVTGNRERSCQGLSPSTGAANAPRREVTATGHSPGVRRGEGRMLKTSKAGPPRQGGHLRGSVRVQAQAPSSRSCQSCSGNSGCGEGLQRDRIAFQ